MTTYARWWSQAWGLVAAFGVGLSWLLWPLLAVPVLWMTSTVFVLLYLLLHANTAPAGKWSLSDVHWRSLVTRSAVLGAAFVGVCAFAVVGPGIALSLLMAAASTSPVAVSWIRRTVIARDADQATPPTVALPTSGKYPNTFLSKCQTFDPAAIRGLSSDELCHTWRRTFVLLHQQTKTAAALAVVELRQACLDEMERRNPAGTRAWLASGPRAAGSPAKYFEGSTDGGQAGTA
jgi:hypothetical protein